MFFYGIPYICITMNLFLTLTVALAVLSPRAIDTRVGTAVSDTPSHFGDAGEVHGNSIPCVATPNGMTYWTSQTRMTEKKGVSPYYYEDGNWHGFRASHWLVGSAVQDYGSFYILPGKEPVPMDHSDEEAQAGYYRFHNHELTGLAHSAVLKLDCNSVTIGTSNIYDEGTFTLMPGDTEVRGENPVHRIYQGWGEKAGFSGWISIQFNRPFIKSEVAADGRTVVLEFAPSDERLMVRMGTSFKSAEKAAENLQTEIPDWDFDAVRAQCEAEWEKILGQVEAEGDEDILLHFYTSLWRASLVPRLVSDCGEAPDYDDFSLWDSFRSLHPLMTLLRPTLSGEMMQSLVRKYERGGWMPIFPCWGSYTSAMIGDHAASVITDAYTKGVRNFDVRKAWEGIRQNAFETPSEELYKDGRGRRALEPYMRLGYLPLEETVPYAFHRNEQASRTLEYAYDDWCGSVLAAKMGDRKTAKILRKRSENWRNVFDPRTLYPQGRYEDGTFLDENNYLRKTSFITEGTPCHYSWFVPHNVKGLVELFGKEEFEARLDSMFTENRYWHGNEPCHQVAYLYDWVGRPDKTRKTIASILEAEYRNTPGGLSGNDDGGQMSAWYVFSALGFYPVCPGSGEYALGHFAFDRVTIHLENGRDFTIVNKRGENGKYRLRGRRLRKPFIRHRDILRGGTLEYAGNE